MVRLASRFGRMNSVRRDRPLTRDELAKFMSNRLAEQLKQAMA